jgi:predicted TIM-barrel fold metal-dependent hydrolase
VNAIAERALRGECLSPHVFIVDWHVHAGKWVAINLPSHRDDELVRRAQAVGVAKLCVNATIWPDLRAGNDAVAALVARYPETVVGFAVTNPYQHDMVAEVRRCLGELGFRAVKLHVMHDTRYSPRAIGEYTREWDRLFAFLSERHTPVLFHGIVTEAMIRAWPDVPFVAAHGSGHPAQNERLARYPNYHIDTASTQNLAWSVREAVDTLGADRVIWGTDAPGIDFAQRLGAVLASGLSESDQRKLLGGNAARLLRLPVPDGPATTR